MKRLLPLFALLLTHFVYSQTPEFDWGSNFTIPPLGSGGANLSDIEPTSDGGAYALLNFSGTYDMDPSPSTMYVTSNGSFDVAVIRLDQFGELVWAKSFGGLQQEFGIKLAVNSSEDVYITGDFLDSVDFDPGVNEANAQSVGNRDGFIVVLDSNGNYINSKTFGGVDVDAAFEIDFDQNDQCFVSGRYIDSVNLNPEGTPSMLFAPSGTGTFVAKVDSNLSFEPILFMDAGEQCGIFDFEIAENNEIHYVGYFSETLNAVFTDSVFQKTSNGSVDVIYGIMDTQGNNSEYIHFGGPYYDLAYALDEMSNGNFVTFVSYADSLMFDLNGTPIYYEGNNVGPTGEYFRRNTAVVKFDGVDVQWVKTANVQVAGGSPNGICTPGRDIKVDENDNIYMALSVDGVCSVNQSNLGTFGSQNSTGTVLTRQNADGFFTGLYSFTGTGSSIPLTLDIGGDNLFLGLSVFSEVDFDLTEFVDTPSVSGMCLAKYELNGPFLSDSELSEVQTVLYPNPANEILEFRAPQVSNVIIYDLAGREVHPSHHFNGEAYEINTSQLQNGTYVLSYTDGGLKFTERFIVQH